jgi:cysteine desulfurase/selenocysteine lyase
MSTRGINPDVPQDLPHGWPDEEALSRLANEFFSAQPGGHSSGNSAAPPPLDARSIPHDLNGDVPLGRSAPSAVGVPGEAELRALLDLIPHSTLTPPSMAAPGNAPAFYFLEHVDSARPTQPQPSQQGFGTPFDVNAIRRDFPILEERVNGRQLVWLDNAATTQKPSAVIDRLKYFYEHENSNIHRAAHELAARATDAYESARDKVRAFLNAGSVKEIVFVRGATEAINLVAQSWGRQNIGKDDEIVISWLEHHANIVPWQQLATEKGAKLRVIPVDDSGQILLDEFGKLLNSKTKLVSFTQVSNALGTITPARQIIEAAHAAGAKVLLDGAQSVSHMPVNVQDLNPDWFVFSGHKVFAPTGIGVLYGKEELLNETQPWQGGGNMIQDVTFERTVYQPAPGRFEAGTGNIADAVGLGAAIDYVNSIGLDRIADYEHQLLLYTERLLKEIPGLRLIGTAQDKAGVISFVIDGYRTEDIGSALNREGIAVRSGHHCAQPILRRFGVESSVRPSLAFYNTCADIDALIAALLRLSSHRTHF